jgi:methyl-accepting chemotaxis protein WspA
LVAVIISTIVVRQLSATLQKLMMALIQVNSSTTEMTATLKEQQVSANEVASTSVEIGATAKEISATTNELGKTMSDVAAVAEHTAQIASGGQAGLSRLEGTMRQIMGATNTISAKLAILNEKTANINSMVTTINKVADQTNLLSLNAAIEAEKAGEFGQGFAVVATEIRRLADQTAVATYDIEQMVKEMQSAVSAGVMGMDKFAEEVRRGNEEVCGVTAQLVQIIQQVQALTPRFESVNDGMQTQSAAAGQISEALTQLGETAQQSAQALLQNTEAVEQLTEASHSLQSAVERFKSKDSPTLRS